MSSPLPVIERRAFFLVGATASGKSAVAQYLAEQCLADILAADAMQVYRGMDIGTAKPTAAERARVRYFGLDLVEPHEFFSAGAYRQAALQALQEATARGRPLIVVGGTGLYIKSLTSGLSPAVPRQEAVRLQAERLLAEEGLLALQEYLERIAPERFAALSDKKNPRRIIRALETALSGQTTLARNWPSAKSATPIPGLMWSAGELYARIQQRAKAMFAGGLLNEVERLLHSGIELGATARKAIGYAEAASCLRKQCSLEEAIERTALRTRQLAKRQMTWFRHQCNVAWLAVDDTMTVPEIARDVLAHWLEQGPTPIVTAP